MSKQDHFEDATLSLPTEETYEGMVSPCLMVAGVSSFLPYRYLAKTELNRRLPPSGEMNLLTTEAIPHASIRSLDTSKRGVLKDSLKKDSAVLEEMLATKKRFLSVLENDVAQVQPPPASEIQPFVRVVPQAHGNIDVADPPITKPSYVELLKMSTIDEGTGQVMADPPPPVGHGVEEAPTWAELSHLCSISDD